MITTIARKVAGRAAVYRNSAISDILTANLAVIGISAVARITAHATARAFSRTIIGS